VRRRGASAILRGLRNLTDLDYEFRIALTNRKVAGVETVFIMTREDFGCTSSSLIKQIVTLGGDPHQLSALLPAPVIDRLVILRKNRVGPFARTPTDTLDS
jgi:pantetheine-phosphate adenylyltransferase